MPYEKVGKNEPVCIADEVPFEIPKSWEWVRLNNVIELQSGQDMTSDKYNSNGNGIPYITGASNIKNGKVLINRWTNCGRAFAYKGDILLTCKGTVGTMAVLQESQVHIARQIMAIRPIGELYVPYIQLVLQTLVESLKAVAKSMIPGIARDDVLQSLFPVPPFNEQQRIVNKFSMIVPYMEQYSMTSTKLSSLNSIFPEVLKKSILQEAVQGKLVPQDPSDEPASVLLERIRAEKERLIQEGKIKRDKHESVIYRRDNSHYEKLDGIERCIYDEMPFEIPESWCWCRLGNLIQSIDAGKSFKCDEHPPTQNECGIIKVSAVTWGRFKQEESKTCFSTNQWIRDYAIQPGDFLICRANTAALVGGCVIVEEISKKLMLSDKVLRLRFFNNVNKMYILYMLRSPFVRTQLSTAASGTSESMKNISQYTIKSLLIPFPPLEEQYRIISKIAESLPKVMTL